MEAKAVKDASSLLHFSGHSELETGLFLEFSVEWFAFPKFNSFRNSLFLKTVPFAAVSKFSIVLLEWKAPIVL